MNDAVVASLLTGTVNVVDVGARGGLEFIVPKVGRTIDFAPFSDMYRTALFEPDPDEAARLQGDLVIAYAAADYTGTATLHLTRGRGCSSLREPNLELISKASASKDVSRYEVDKKIEVPVTTIDAALEERQFRCDILKTDTQGTEYEVLRGSSRSLTDTVAVSIELSNTVQYKDQVLSAEIIHLLFDAGFDLVHTVYKPNLAREYDCIFMRPQSLILSRQQALAAYLYANTAELWRMADSLRANVLPRFYERNEQRDVVQDIKKRIQDAGTKAE
jgi:FkbM family methyltransferase